MGDGIKIFLIEVVSEETISVFSHKTTWLKLRRKRCRDSFPDSYDAYLSSLRHLNRASQSLFL